MFVFEAPTDLLSFLCLFKKEWQKQSYLAPVSYTQLDVYKRQVQSCSVCNATLSSSYSAHTFTYGSWQSDSAAQHRRAKTCSACGDSEYEYACLLYTSCDSALVNHDMYGDGLRGR